MKTLTAQAEDVSAKKSLAWFADLLADVHPRVFGSWTARIICVELPDGTGPE